jgi:hypothetical protein
LHDRCPPAVRPRTEITHVVCAGCLALAASLWAPIAAAADDPLPDRKTFLAEIRKRLRPDAAILRQYAYTRTVVEQLLDGEGRVTETRMRVYEVRPLPGDSEGRRWLTMKDGVPVSAAELQRLEREYQQQLARAERRFANESPPERQRRLVREQAHAREERQNLEDALAIYAVDLKGRETVNGVAAVVVTFAPRRDIRPRTRAGGLLAKVAGRAWFSESEHELVRLEATAVEPIRYGWGILARINEGASAMIDRRRAPDGMWLPDQYVLNGSGRVLLVRGISRRGTITFSNYRRPPRAGGAAGMN